MKKLFAHILLLLSGLGIKASSASILDLHHTQEKNTLFQVATISSLTQGVYNGNYSYKKLMQQGNFGLGTFLDLNGEMVAIDGHFYQIEANGKLKTVKPEQIVPFAEVTYFKPSIYNTLANLPNYNTLGTKLIQLFPNKNIPYAIRIDGKFKVLKLRSLRKQSKPYPNLVQASENQAIFNLKDVKGTIVGFWFPEYWGSIAVPGFHLHFVTTDHTTGGHVLEIDVDEGQLSMAPLYQVKVYLPNTSSFADADLSDEALRSSIKKAEGGSSNS